MLTSQIPQDEQGAGAGGEGGDTGGKVKTPHHLLERGTQGHPGVHLCRSGQCGGGLEGKASPPQGGDSGQSRIFPFLSLPGSLFPSSVPPVPEKPTSQLSSGTQGRHGSHSDQSRVNLGPSPAATCSPAAKLQQQASGAPTVPGLGFPVCPVVQFPFRWYSERELPTWSCPAPGTGTCSSGFSSSQSPQVGFHVNPP